MGCVLAKPSMSSPQRGIEKMKIDNGYVGGGGRRALPSRPQSRGVVDGEEREGNGPSHRIYPPPQQTPMPMPMPMPVRQVAGGDVDDLVDGWPRWLVNNVPKDVLAGLVPKSADSYDKLAKVGQGTYSNVYKARDRDTGKIVALKKVRFDTSESESVRFMAREIMILQKLDHPNVIKLEGLATSRMQYSLYLVFDFMLTDLARVISRPDGRLTEPQIKCYMMQLLSGLQHCHENGILHRDIKGSNLLIDKQGMLKIADFGLANYFNPNKKRPLTSRVVTLWYRAPELLLGTTDYGVGIDLWSAGCLLAEMFAGRPIMPGRTEVEQLHRIFKLCGSPSEDYWRKLKLSSSFRPVQPYKSSISEAFKDFPSSSLGLLTMLLALDPSYRGSAASALQNEFFSASPLACDLSGLPEIYKEDNDEPGQLHERRRRKGSKLNRRSRTSKEGKRKTETTLVQPKGNSRSSKEEKVADPGRSSDDFGSTTGSTSSGVKPRNHSVSPPETESMVISSLRERQRRTEGHPLATKNIKNLPPVTITEITDLDDDKSIEKIRHYGLDKRSASMSIYRRVDDIRIPKPSVFVD
ncbi:[RNA-polymerase]-subunit kinase protein [Dioscorea alata]|uniref:[RNA-polymerase]-subunit kinase protein n=1 Tax=Dioscorea alata TaxID=55571 RepID=A0ACB7VLG4_DIOAL|nr:[RNA-polymerase]-subunit kinase protein [Dioscorea alata]